MQHFKFTALYLALLWGACGPLGADEGDIQASGQIISDTTGEPPLVVNSANRVPNLNADLLDGKHAWEFAPVEREQNISIPTKSVEIFGSAEYDSNSWVQGIKLAAADNSYFGTGLVIPSDLEPTGLQIRVDILIHNPSANGACTALIVPAYTTGYRPGTGTISISFNSPSPSFPAFTSGDMTNFQTYRLSNMESGDSVYFGWRRNGNDVSDTCGDVRLVGMNIRI